MLGRGSKYVKVSFAQKSVGQSVPQRLILRQGINFLQTFIQKIIMHSSTFYLDALKTSFLNIKKGTVEHYAMTFQYKVNVGLPRHENNHTKKYASAKEP